MISNYNLLFKINNTECTIFSLTKSFTSEINFNDLAPSIKKALKLKFLFKHQSEAEATQVHTVRFYYEGHVFISGLITKTPLNLIAIAILKYHMKLFMF